MARSDVEFATESSLLLEGLEAGTITPTAFRTAWIALWTTENLTVASLALEASRLIETVKGRLMFGPVFTLASATTVQLGDAETHAVKITGNVTIGSFGNTASLDNPFYYLRFTGTPTLTHNATSMILPGGANIAVAADGAALVEYLGGSNWRVWFYWTPDGLTAPVNTALAAKQTSSTVLTYLATASTNTAVAVKTLLGLNNVDNTSDANKPVSTAAATALNGKAALSTEGVFTPTLTFGGAAVGITYAEQTGRWWKSGKLVQYEVRVGLSNKGSSAGDVRVVGVPFNPVLNIPGSIMPSDMGASVNSIMTLIQTTGQISVHTMNAGVITDLNNTHFTNSSYLRICGCFTVA